MSDAASSRDDRIILHTPLQALQIFIEQNPAWW
jgi:hypothetical protein